VFAVWVARSEWLATHTTEATQVIEALIASKNNFLQSETHQNQAYELLKTSTTLPENILKRYWTQSLDYGWSEGHQASVNRLAALMQPFKTSCLV
jgi:predicted solute-binding protein